jgi:hypothetical protein
LKNFISGNNRTKVAFTTVWKNSPQVFSHGRIKKEELLEATVVRSVITTL